MSDHDRVSKLFLEACGLPAAERAAFLESACGGDLALRAEVEAMLVQDTRVDATGELAARVLGAAAEAPTELPVSPLPDRIGPYRLLQKIGEGGMGEVWLAEQTEPVRRRVALKIIKAGMDTKQVVARFEAERQALAMMDHPTIAKVFDAGATPQGRPYFVMEYIQGVPITDHCDRQRLTNRARLELFVQVCEGVQHAHHKAVIHRDLKPSNVLVTLLDGRAVPKIIDFGVAKATAQRLTEKTMFTELGALIGTPEYMSPEQAEMTGQDVDTRTDVYALGVILYELLVGALPFDSKALRGVGFAEIARKIREDEPPRPSTRVSTLGDQSTESASRRSVDLRTLRSQLRGDLDWITMKALEKDRTRRYGSPAELAADLERQMRDEPVSAGAPSVGYRARKFVRRHRIGVLAVGGAALALLLGVVGTTVELFRAKEAELTARRESQTSERVAGFLSNMMEDVDPQRMGNLLVRDLGERARGPSGNVGLGQALSGVSGTDTARRLLDEEILARAASSIDKQFADDPLIAARLRHTLAKAYTGLGMPNAAEVPETWALETRERLLGSSDPLTLNSAAQMARIRYRQGRFPEAEALARRTLQASERVLGAEHPDTVNSIHMLAVVLRDQDRLDEAAELYQRELSLRRRILPPEDPLTLRVMNDLGRIAERRSSFREAEQLHRRLLEIRLRVLGPENIDTLDSLANVAVASLELGKVDEAARLAQQGLETRRRLFGSDHPFTLTALHLLARIRTVQGRLDEAAHLQREALESRKRTLGATHPDTLASLTQGANIEYYLGHLLESRRDAEEALSSRRRSLGDGHRDTAWTLYVLRRTCWAGGWLDAVRELDREMLLKLRQAAERSEADCNVLTGCAFAILDSERVGSGDAGAALKYAERAVQLTESKEAMPLAAVARAQYVLGDASRAVESQKKAIGQLTPAEGPMRAYLESQLARYEAGR